MADITEARIYEALGIEPAGDGTGGSGAQGQGVAAPAAQLAVTGNTPGGGNTDSEGAQGQGIAAPATQPGTNDPTGQTAPTAGQAEPGETGDTAGQDPEGDNAEGLTLEQRRQNAARRREQERQAAIDAAVQEERQKSAAQLQQFFQAAGLKDTFTGEPITSLEQFYAWNEKIRGQKLQESLRSGKLTPEVLEQAISDHPLVKQASEIIKQNQEQQRANAQAAAKARVDEQLTEIGKMDPTIQSLQDLIGKPWYPELYGYVKRGFSLSEAYRQVNHEALLSAAAEAARQQTMNNARGKEHLSAMGGGSGAGAISVPADVKAMFLSFNPNATDAQIQAYYNKYKKK